MTRDWYKTLLWLMWLALPLVALDYWRAWDALPERMAVHFDADWSPNGYTTREGAVELGLGILSLLLLTSTIAAVVSRAQKPSSAWPVLVISYVVVGISCYANLWLIDFNLKEASHRLLGT
jgi:hypothetical protein